MLLRWECYNRESILAMILNDLQFKKVSYKWLKYSLLLFNCNSFFQAFNAQCPLYKWKGEDDKAISIYIKASPLITLQMRLRSSIRLSSTIMMVLSAGNLILTYPENQMIQSWELVVSWAIRLTCLYSAVNTLEEKMFL